MTRRHYREESMCVLVYQSGTSIWLTHSELCIFLGGYEHWKHDLDSIIISYCPKISELTVCLDVFFNTSQMILLSR